MWLPHATAPVPRLPFGPGVGVAVVSCPEGLAVAGVLLLNFHVGVPKGYLDGAAPFLDVHMKLFGRPGRVPHNVVQSVPHLQRQKNALQYTGGCRAVCMILEGTVPAHKFFWLDPERVSGRVHDFGKREPTGHLVNFITPVLTTQ